MTGLSALVVEDQAPKAAKIRELLSSLRVYSNEQVDIAPSGIDARRLLRKKQYDLMILDIVLPNRPGEQPQTEGGVDLLREVMSRDNFKRPKYILGLTAFPDAFQTSAGEFADYTWAIIKYEEDEPGWHDPIRQLSRHIYEAARSGGKDAVDYDYDFCVVTALQSPEFESLLRLSWGWRDLRAKGDPTEYKEALTQVKGVSVRIVAGCTPRMGMVSAAVLSANMIRTFRPRIIVSLGICAGLRERVSIGDIAVADPSWDYQSGKLTSKSFEVAPHQLALNSAIRRRLSALRDKRDLLRRIKESWTGTKPVSELRMHIGPFASGSAVLANKDKLEELKLQHRQLVAIDMEVYGVYAAAAEASFPIPFPVGIKAVSDFGDEAKRDEFRDYCGHVCANIYAAFVEEEYADLLSLLSSC